MDWDSVETEVLINPRLPHVQQKSIQDLLLSREGFSGHVWVASSGSTAKNPHEQKFAALSKTAILASAAAVNQHLEATAKDRWLSALPGFHVGGLGITARAYLLGSSVSFLEKWDPHLFHGLLTNQAITLTSLVPAQVFDLVSQKISPPKALRAVIVGGGALSPAMDREARLLGWPILESYGLTECSSQVATAKLGEKSLYLLPHVQAKITDDGCIALKSLSLLSAYAFLTESGVQILDPKIDGWLVTQDRGLIAGGYLELLGRKDDFIKIGGESVALARLQALFEQARLRTSTSFDAAIFPMPDERLGHAIHLAVAAAVTATDYEALCTSYNASVLPFERIRKVHLLPKLPRSALNKLLLAELLHLTAGSRIPS